jgi:protein involved in polysaccharide export with SLBB domain
MSIENVGSRWSRCVVIGALVLGGICMTGCQSQAPKPQFADVPSGVIAPSAGASPSVATTPTAAPISPAPVAPAVPAAAPANTATAAPAPTTAVALAITNSASLYSEVLRVGDGLTVTFTDTPIPIPVFEEKIKEDGTITLSLNQVFKAEGKTLGALEKEIRARYVPDYYKFMTVTLRHQESTRWYYVLGEVRSPSRQIYTSRTTVTKAIASVGGFTDFANKKSVKLTRVDGRTFTVNCVKALDNPTLDLEVYPGDKIYVKRSIW